MSITRACLRRRREAIHAAFFSVFLLTLLLSSFAAAMGSMGPVVLGTEMNTNGYVEYLCLGSSCEAPALLSYAK